MSTEIQCPNCNTLNFLPADDFDDECGTCGNNLYTFPDTEGNTLYSSWDVIEDHDGVTIFTPDDTLNLHDDDAAQLLINLTRAVQRRLEVLRGDNVHQLRRPTGQTAELAAIADHHA